MSASKMNYLRSLEEQYGDQYGLLLNQLTANELPVTAKPSGAKHVSDTATRKAAQQRLTKKAMGEGATRTDRLNAISSLIG